VLGLKSLDWRFRRSPKVTACLINKDEGRYLAEWLAHYLTLGFDRVLLYDNDSRADTLAAERACAASDPRITVIPWPDVLDLSPQITAYDDALKRCETEWISFFDTDEFLVLKKHRSIQSYLAEAPGRAGAVAINWLLFGSSGEKYYRPEPVTMRFRRCSSKAVANTHVKCIARKAGCASIGHAHSPALKRGYVYVDSDLKPFALDGRAFNAAYSYETAQLNHYVLRSREEFEAKRRRGSGTQPINAETKFKKFADPEAFWARHDTNDETDPSVLLWTAMAKDLRETFERAVAFEVTSGWSERPVSSATSEGSASNL